MEGGVKREAYNVTWVTMLPNEATLWFDMDLMDWGLLSLLFSSILTCM